MGEATRDHLAALFDPAATGSRGVYGPGGFDLHLGGTEAPADRLVHHHEAQHVLLTATTAWGAALLVASRVPSWSSLFDQLLYRCRLTHESFATYLSCSTVAVGFGTRGLALASYPAYEPLLARLDRYLTHVPGEHRRSLAMIALARVCMQTPILDHLITSWPMPITPRSLRGVDVPDERLTHLLRDPDGLPVDLVQTADAAVATEFGPDPLTEDRPGGAALEDRFDSAWAHWEESVFAGLAVRLTAVGASVIPGNEHMRAATQLVARARAAVAGLGLIVSPDPAPTEQQATAAVLREMRLWLRGTRRPARVITVGQDVDLAEVLRVADATTRVDGRPNLVLNARLPARLLAGYDLQPTDRARLEATGTPVVVLRTIADDGTDSDTDIVWLVRLADPADVVRVAAAWHDRGDLTFCVAASCLADARWREEWLPMLRDTAPINWLIDVSIAALSDTFCSGRVVQGLYLDLGSTSTGATHAVAFKVVGLAGVWVAVVDEVGVQLITQQVAALPGIDLRMTDADWSEVLPSLRLTLLDLLRTESYMDFRGLSDRRT